MIFPSPPVLQEPAPDPDAAVMLDQAHDLREQKRWPEAVAIYTRMLDISKDHQLALFERAQILSWMKRFDESIRDYKRYLAIYPDRAAATEPALAKVTAWSKRFQEAVRILVPYVRRRDRSATLDTATFLSWDGQLSKSLAMTEAWLKAQPSDRDFLVLQGRVQGWKGNHAQARRSYQDVLVQVPGDPDALRGLAQLDLWAGNPEGAATRLALLPSEDAQSPESELMQSQIDQRMGRLRQSRARAEALRGNLDVQEDVRSRIRDLTEAQGPWVELSQTRTDSNEGLRAQAQRVDAAVPLRDGSLRVGGALYLLTQGGKPERRPQEWDLGFNHPLGSRLSVAAQAGRTDDVGGAPASSHTLSLNLRAAPGLNLSLYQSFAPVVATPKATDLRTSIRTWGLNGNWVFNQTLDTLGATLDRGFLSAGPSRNSLRLEGTHRFPLEGGEVRLGLASRLIDQDETLNLGFFNPQRYRYYGATAGATRRREERWELALDAWAGHQTVNQSAGQFSWGYTLSGTWTPVGSSAAMFASWSQSVAGLPISDSTAPTNYRDHTLRFGVRIRGNRWPW